MTAESGTPACVTTRTPLTGTQTVDLADGSCHPNAGRRPSPAQGGTEDSMTAPAHTFADLLRSAVSEPGIVSAAYRQFHSYSIGNQLLAWSQCLARDLQPGPLATFMGWKDKGRHVKRG